MDETYAEWCKKANNLLRRVEESIGDVTRSPEEVCRQLVTTIKIVIHVLRDGFESDTQMSLKRMESLHQQVKYATHANVVDRDTANRLEMKLYDLVEHDPALRTAYEIAGELELLQVFASKLLDFRRLEERRALSADELSAKKHVEELFRQKSDYLRNEVGWIGPIGTTEIDS